MTVMKIRTALVALVLGVASLAAAPRMQAQNTIAKANIPFDFQYGRTHLKAGQYTISVVSGDVLQLQGTRTAFAVTRMGQNARPCKTSKLVFNRYGDQYVLKQVWMANDIDHLEIPKGKTERRLQQLAQNTPDQNSSDIEIALLESPR